ncbi:hypothetical protein L208DRAFT_1235885, partial [Tricholoma matsutake]
TYSACTIYHEAQAALHPLFTNVQTQEQLDTLIGHVSDIWCTENAQDYSECIHDPPVIKNKGRPRSACITGPLEGQPCGRGAKGTTSSA